MKQRDQVKRRIITLMIIYRQYYIYHDIVGDSLLRSVCLNVKFKQTVESYTHLAFLDDHDILWDVFQMIFAVCSGSSGRL